MSIKDLKDLKEIENKIIILGNRMTKTQVKI